MRLARYALIAAAALTTACASDGTTSATTAGGDTRLAAVATVTAASATDGTPVTVRVNVTSSLSEQVTGGACGTQLQARAVSGTTWTDVLPSLAVCNASAVLIAPGATISLTATADAAKLRTVAAAGSQVVLRARQTFTGASTTYTMQSNEITTVVP